MLRGVVRARSVSAFSQAPHRRNRRSSAPQPFPRPPRGQYFGAWRERVAGVGGGRPGERLRSALVRSSRRTRPLHRPHQHLSPRARCPTTDPSPDSTEDGGEPEPRPFRLGDLTPFLLIRAAHPRQALITVGRHDRRRGAGRASQPRAAARSLGTVLVGQVILGWFNDLVDRKRDARHQRTGKPLSDGRLDPGTVWFCLALAVFLRASRCPWATGCTPGRRTSSGARHRPGRAAGSGCARRCAVLAAVGGDLRAAARPSSRTAAGAARSNGDPPEHAHHRAGRTASAIGVHLLTALPGLVAGQRGPACDLPPAASSR